jgi:exodeoxyribonuclease-3
MRVITCNTNGIRSAERKGFFPWLETQNADVVCIQETKAQIHQLDQAVFAPQGYHCVYNDAERPGYSGTALFSRAKPKKITTRLGWEPMDSQGRYLQADFKGLSVISLYVPSGSSGDEAQARKEVFMVEFFEHLKTLRRKRREFIICADWNICHREIDLKNWRGNQKNSGFLPHERAWLDRVFDELGWVDVFRRLDPRPDQYTWWSNRGQAWSKNVGWRLDYLVTTPKIAQLAQSTSIYKDERFSDHAPLIMDFDIELAS